MLLKSVTLTVLLTLIPTASLAANRHSGIEGREDIKYGQYSTNSGSFYYELGGSEIVRSSYGAGRRSRLRLQANLSASYSCGEFDAFENIEQIMNDLKRGIDQLGNTISYGVGQAVSALPMYLLYEADPILAQMITNARFSAEEAFKLSIKSCEQLESSIMAGNGFDKFMQWNMAHQLKKEAVAGNTATQAVKRAQTQASCPRGVSWVGGIYAGGLHNDPIDIERDTIIAGYNLLRDYDNPKDLRATTDTALLEQAVFKTWETPAEAADWFVTVAGRTSVELCERQGDKIIQKTQPSTAPGKGLMPDYNAYKDLFYDFIDRLVFEPEVTSTHDYELANIDVSKKLIDAIKANGDGSPMLIGRIASELALKATLEKALNAKRLLMTGAKDPDIDTALAVKPFITQARQRLNREIELLNESAQLTQNLVSPTSVKIIRHYEKQRLIEASENEDTSRSSLILNDGAVQHD